MACISLPRATQSVFIDIPTHDSLCCISLNSVDIEEKSPGTDELFFCRLEVVTEVKAAIVTYPNCELSSTTMCENFRGQLEWRQRYVYQIVLSGQRCFRLAVKLRHHVGAVFLDR